MTFESCLDSIKAGDGARQFIQGGCGQATQGFTVESIAGAECWQQFLALLFRLVTRRKGFEDRGQTDRKQCVGLEGFLMAQQMEFDQKLISQSTIQRGDDVRERLVKRPLAVRDRLTVGQLPARVGQETLALRRRR